MIKVLFKVILFGCVCLGVEDMVLASTISPITPLSEDYWKPTESMEYEIVFSNICDAPCYVEGVVVNRLEVSDVETNETFSESEMEFRQISDEAYETELRLNDRLLFQGSMDALVQDEVYFEKPIYLREETSITLQFDVSFEAESGNGYQNKQYVYEFLPFGYRVIEEVEKPQVTSPVTGIEGSLMVVGCLLLVVGVMSRKGDD